MVLTFYLVKLCWISRVVSEKVLIMPRFIPDFNCNHKQTLSWYDEVIDLQITKSQGDKIFTKNLISTNALYLFVPLLQTVSCIRQGYLFITYFNSFKCIYLTSLCDLWVTQIGTTQSERSLTALDIRDTVLLTNQLYVVFWWIENSFRIDEQTCTTRSWIRSVDSRKYINIVVCTVKIPCIQNNW